MKRLLGTYNTIPVTDPKKNPKKDPFLQAFEEDFGFIRDDCIMTISPKGTYTNGASLPKIMWPILDSPLEMPNCLWAANHDSAYRNSIIIIDCKNLLPSMSPKRIFKFWREIDESWFIHRRSLPRKWYDQNMVEVMECVGESKLKRKLAYWGVRLGGRKRFKKNLDIPTP